MKKKYSSLKLVVIVLITLSIISCKKNNIVVDKDTIIPVNTSSHILLENYANGKSYFVHDVNNKPAKIYVGLSNAAVVPTSVGFSYKSVSGAVNGTGAGSHYLAPLNLMFKTGTSLDSIALSADYATYAAGRVDTVVIKINTPAYYGQDSVTYYISKYCDVVTADLEGSYDSTFSTNTPITQPYSSSVLPFTSTGTKSASAAFNSLVYRTGSGTEYPLDELPFTINWSDESAFSVNIDETSAMIIGANSYNVRTSTSKISTFSSCKQTFILYLDFVNSVTRTPFASGYKIILKR